jgi:hypothetical protein
MGVWRGRNNRLEPAPAKKKAPGLARGFNSFASQSAMAAAFAQNREKIGPENL